MSIASIKQNEGTENDLITERGKKSTEQHQRGDDWQQQ